MPQREVAYPRFVSRKRKTMGWWKRAVAEGWVRRSSGEWRRRWVTDRAWRRRWPPWMWMLSLPCEIGHPKTDCEKIPFGSCTPFPCLYHHLSFSICIYLEQFSFLLFDLCVSTVEIFLWFQRNHSLSSFYPQYFGTLILPSDTWMNWASWLAHSLSWKSTFEGLCGLSLLPHFFVRL